MGLFKLSLIIYVTIILVYGIISFIINGYKMNKLRKQYLRSIKRIKQLEAEQKERGKRMKKLKENLK